MLANGQARPTIVQSDAGKPINFGSGRGASVMLDGEQTGGTLAVVLGHTRPNGGPPPHVHERDDELFLVAEGTISYFYDGAWTDVGPGGVVYFPKGTPHGLRNNGTTPASHWIVTTPSGFEQFYARSAEEVTRPGGPDMVRLTALEAEYGYTVFAEAQPALPRATPPEAGGQEAELGSSQARPTILQPGEGQRGVGVGNVVKLGGAQTGGSLAVVLSPVPPGGGPPLHVHAPDDEVFLVVEGIISYFCDGAWTDVGPGGVVYFPKGTPHKYRNNGTTPALHWTITTPSGFDQFLPKLEEELTRPGGPDRDRIHALHAEHGYTLLDDF